MFRILIFSRIKDISRYGEISLSLNVIYIGNHQDIISPEGDVRFRSVKDTLQRNGKKFKTAVRLLPDNLGTAGEGIFQKTACMGDELLYRSNVISELKHSRTIDSTFDLDTVGEGLNLASADRDCVTVFKSEGPEIGRFDSVDMVCPTVVTFNINASGICISRKASGIRNNT